MASETNNPLDSLSIVVQELDKSCINLIQAMADQLKAVIASDADRIMDLTELNASAQETYQGMERRFYEELKQLLPEKQDDKDPVTLELLKKKFPDNTALINKWQEKLTDNVVLLQRQQHQLVQLLDFAQGHNAALMRSIYGSRTDKNVQYQQNGEKKSVASGMAINQKG